MQEDSNLRSPVWKDDELILALDLYFREPRAIGDDKHPAVVALSEELNNLPIHPSRQKGQIFRNPNGVALKLANFQRLDPASSSRGRKGMPHGSKREVIIWDEYAGDKRRLSDVASAIRHGAKVLAGPIGEEREIEDVEDAPEGRILTQLHRRRERDPRLIKSKKRAVVREKGCLACEVCGFDFFRTYGAPGEDFIECHHKKPVSEMGAGGRTSIDDLAIVCANCHRMIHRRRPWLTLDQLRATVAATAKTHR